VSCFRSDRIKDGVRDDWKSVALTVKVETGKQIGSSQVTIALLNHYHYQ
jgi:hypothetical protein